MNYFIFQGNDHDCGFASLKMLMANVKKDKSYLYISKNKKKEFFSFKDLKEIASDYGLVLGSYRCDEDYYDHLSCPCLTVIRKNHMIMIKKASKRKVTIFDPELGILTLKKDDFLAMWDKTVIEIENSSLMEKLPRSRRNVLPLKLRVIEAVAALVSSIVLVVTFYLLNNEKNAVFSLIFLVLFATTQIIENIIIVKELKFFDSTYINKYFYLKKNKTKEKYYEFIYFKQNYFSGSRGLITSILVATMITFLLCLNDFRNIFVLLALILLKVLEQFLFYKSENKIRNRIEEYESKAFTRNELCIDYLCKANILATNEVLSRSLKQIFYIIISFAFSIGMMYITGSSGCNYVIFHFGLYYVGFTSFSQVITGLSFRKERYKEECRFFDTCNL